MSERLRETDLYQPVADYLTARGYTVRGEVKDCDLAAVKGDALIVVELKLSLTLGLLAQAVKRQQLTESVYVAVPRPSNVRKWMGQTKDARRVVRRLELGLLLVHPDAVPTVEVLCHPMPAARQQRSRKRRAVIEEAAGRSEDFNQGGSTRRTVMTAYRENAVRIAACLEALGPSKPKALRALGTGPKTLSILARNVYGWFERVDVGVYALSAKGRAALGAYPELAAKYCPAAECRA